MLKRANRVKQKKDFSKIFREGKKINTEFLLLKVSKNNNGESRFGFVVSKKISKNSTTRNKIKRILSEIIRNKSLEIKKGFDAVVIVKRDFSKRKFSEIEREVSLILKQNFLLNK